LIGFCYENQFFWIHSIPLGQNTLSLRVALAQSMVSSSSAQIASKTSSQTPKWYMKCSGKFMKDDCLQLLSGKMILLAELLHFFESGCSSRKHKSALSGKSKEPKHMT